LSDAECDEAASPLGPWCKGGERREALLATAQETLGKAAERADVAEMQLTALRRVERLAAALDGDSNLREVKRLGEEVLQAKLSSAGVGRHCSSQLPAHFQPCWRILLATSFNAFFTVVS